MNEFIIKISLYFKNLSSLQSIFGVLLLLISFSIPFAARGVSSTFIIGLFLIWLISKMPIRNFHNLVNKRARWLILSFGFVYIFYLAGYFYSPDSKSAMNSLMIKISLFIFPLIYALSDSKIFNNFLKNSFLSLFVIGNLINLFLLFINAYMNFSQTGEIKHFFYTSLAYNQHTSYTAMYAVFSVFILLEKLLNTSAFNFKYFIQISLLILFIVLLSSKAGLISLLVLLIFSLIFFLLKFKKPLKTIISIFIFIIYGFFLFKALPLASKRISIAEKTLETKKEVRSKNPEGTAVRLTVWENSIELIKMKPLFGYGTGNVKNIIQSKEQIAESNYMQNLKPDAHNQYLQTTLAIGLLGLFALIFILIASFFSAIKNKNYLLMILILLTTMNWLTESMLERQNGSMFFSLMLGFLIANQFYNKSKNEILINSISD